MGRYRGSKTVDGPGKPQLTHFLCLPLVTESSRPQLDRSLQEFRNAVALESPSSREFETEGVETMITRVHPKAIRPIGTLHLTLGVMSLNEERLSQAIALLKALDISSMLGKCSSRETSSMLPAAELLPDASALEEAHARVKPLVINLTGLESMHPPGRTSILYSAPSDASGRLYPFCSQLRQVFTDDGFLKPEQRELKLHATIVNTLYAKSKTRKARKTPERPKLIQAQAIYVSEDDEAGTNETSPRNQDQMRGHRDETKTQSQIDATNIIEKYQSFPWALDVRLDRLAICEMGAKKTTDDHGNIVSEQYTEVASVALPT